MKKKWCVFLAASLITSGLGTLSVQAADQEPKGEVYTFLAASLSNAMEKIQKNFNQKYPEIEIFYNADSSGTLQTQIEEGARCDIFFSAAKKQMDALVESGNAEKDSVVDLLENKVVLIALKDRSTKVKGFENITDAESLALAGESVPVGQYAREIFTNMGIMDEVEQMEINEGKNVTEVLASVTEGSNEVGVVYATDAASVAEQVQILAEAPEESLETPVLYPVGKIQDQEATKEDQEAVDLFFTYLKSEDAMEVFEEYGFAVHTSDQEASGTEQAEETKEEAEKETGE